MYCIKSARFCKSELSKAYFFDEKACFFYLGDNGSCKFIFYSVRFNNSKGVVFRHILKEKQPNINHLLAKGKLLCIY